MFYTLVTSFAATGHCSGGGFLGFPTWYKYLPGTTDPKTQLCTPQFTSLSDVWLILAAIIEILLRIAALVAVGFVIYGGAKYIISQGDPDATKKARETIVGALIGLAIAVAATPIVAYLAGHVQ